jgi:thymidylate kinase
MVFMERHVASGHVFSKAYGGLTDEWCSQFDSVLVRPDLVIYLESDLESDDIESWNDPDRYETPEIQTEVQERFHELMAKEPNWRLWQHPLYEPQSRKTF